MSAERGIPAILFVDGAPRRAVVRAAEVTAVVDGPRPKVVALLYRGGAWIEVCGTVETWCAVLGWTGALAPPVGAEGAPGAHRP